MARLTGNVVDVAEEPRDPMGSSSARSARPYVWIAHDAPRARGSGSEHCRTLADDPVGS